MFKRLIASIVCMTFSFSNLQYVHAQPASPPPAGEAGAGGDFSVNQLPVPGTMVGESVSFAPLALKGLVVNPQKPLEFQFIVDTGEQLRVSVNTTKGPQDTASIKDQANQLVKYFLAGLTIPEGDLWVNLSPYEKNRMVPEALGQTDLGRDLLAQDYILKQLTASLIYPEKDLGKEFWSKVYAKAQAQFGTTDIPVNTFNKVWILPDQAQVFENFNAAYVTKSTLKVMLDEDYLALSKHQGQPGDMASAVSPSKLPTQRNPTTNTLASQFVRAIILPEITKEVNTGKNFAPLRQIYQALILAKWYKETIQNGLLDALYTNKNKVAGVNLNDPTVKEQIYERYLKAYKKGAFNYIKEDPTPNGQAVPRKYFSGGTLMVIPLNTQGRLADVKGTDGAMISLTVALVAAGAAIAGIRYKKILKQLADDHSDIYVTAKNRMELLKTLRRLEPLNREEVFGQIKSILQRRVFTRIMDFNNLQKSYLSGKGAKYVDSKFDEKITQIVKLNKSILTFDPRMVAGLIEVLAEFCQDDIEIKKARTVIAQLMSDKQYSDDQWVLKSLAWANQRIESKLSQIKNDPAMSQKSKPDAAMNGEDVERQLSLLRGRLVGASRTIEKETDARNKNEEVVEAYRRRVETILSEIKSILGQYISLPAGQSLNEIFQQFTTDNISQFSGINQDHLTKLFLKLGTEIDSAKLQTSKQEKQDAAMFGQMPLLVSMEAVQEAKEFKPDEAMLSPFGITTSFIIIGFGTALVLFYRKMSRLQLNLVEVLRNPDQTIVFNYINSNYGRNSFKLLQNLKWKFIDLKKDPLYTQNPIAPQAISILFRIPINTDPRFFAGLVKAMAEYCHDSNEVTQTKNFIEELDGQYQDIFIQTAISWARNRLIERGLDSAMHTGYGIKSMENNGGIDLNQIKVNRVGKAVSVQFDPARLDQLEQGGFEGFTPVTTGFIYIKSPLPLLGINTAKTPVQLAKV